MKDKWLIEIKVAELRERRAVLAEANTAAFRKVYEEDQLIDLDGKIQALLWILGEVPTL